MRNLFFIFFVITCCHSYAVAQDFKKDIELLIQQGKIEDTSTNLKNRKKSFNPLSLLYGATLGFYQTQISPQWGANCAFELTCSRFSGAMVKEYGLAKGFFLTLDRMGRCNKLSMYETLPLRITPQGKIIDEVAFYRLQE
ncbi:MAG: membrane protein insertion efficiency factor YidD [Cytophagia bacterium]|nr:membrane protein insertion efficiency factor YidD [Cytophagia bacterium]NBW38547.1 membrane protein insertion efficiency factor YidD [Cytophagia bacterium]